jgi:hypothetical protein
VLRAGQHIRLTASTLCSDCLKNMGTTTVHKLMGLQGLFELQPFNTILELIR